MRITVLGATGGTGRLIVEQALAAGHAVTAVVRDPARLPVPAQAALTVLTAPLHDPAAVRHAVAGADAVLDALGATGSGPTTFRTDTARVVAAAMRDEGVHRIVAVTGSGFDTTGDTPLLRFVVKPVLGRVLRHQYADMRTMEGVVRGSGLAWTIVRPARLTDGPATGRIRRQVDTNVRGSYSITRADLAAVVLEVAADDDLREAAVSVAAG